MQESDVRKEISKDDILSAISDLDRGVQHAFGKSTEYDVLYEDKRYPPKAVVGLAARRVLGRPLRPDEFSAGEGQWSFRLLKDKGFLIVPKEENLPSSSLPSLDAIDDKNVWIENTRADHKHGGPGWEFGTCLWSPSRYAGTDERVGADRYAPMREIRSGDLVLHIVDSVFVGFSFANGEFRELADAPPMPGEWAGRSSYYRVDLRDYQELEEPISVADFVAANEPAIRAELEAVDRPKYYPFILYGKRRQVRPAQGSYISVCTKLLFQNLLKTVNTTADLHRKYWVISPGEGGRLWDEFQEQGIIAIGWDEEDLGDLLNYTDREELHQALLPHRGDGDADPTNDSLCLFQFSREMQPGDIVAAKLGKRQLLGIGKVTGGYQYDERRSEYRHTRQVKWMYSAPTPIPADARPPVKTLTDVTGYAKLVQVIKDALGESIPPKPQTATPKFELAEANALLFLPDDQILEILGALRRKKNIILQGPPGVGKTYAARILAYALMGTRDPSRLELVQFHQSYSYEDFIQGWRPSEGGFKRKEGVFYEFCSRARIDPDREYVFVIDEINRGNVSKIFGELLMLIEADKRGADYAVRLTYSEEPGETFSVPRNVYLIGMMNTADRSLAMVDYALRRRFSFFDLEPAFQTKKFSDYLLAHSADSGAIAKLLGKMSRLNEKIAGSKRDLGRGFRIGHSYFCPNDGEAATEEFFGAVLRQEIEPLLREYFDDAEELEELTRALRS